MPHQVELRNALLAVALWLGACSTANGGQATESTPVAAQPTTFCDLPAACQEISQACMPKDDGTPGPVHDCHRTGMELGIQADCERDRSSCLATCASAPALSDNPPDDLFAACRDGGGTDAGPVTFPVAPLSTFVSDGKDLHIELRTAPEQPIAVGPVGEGELRVSDVSSGAPVDGLTIAVATWMPMGHPCSPVDVRVEPQGGGVYRLTPFLASMKGACEVKLTFSGEKSERAVSPTFDITH